MILRDNILSMSPTLFINAFLFQVYLGESLYKAIEAYVPNVIQCFVALRFSFLITI